MAKTRTTERPVEVSRIVSGGQTGADRAALDFAISRGIQHGGWVPKGRKAEDRPLAPKYIMRETATSRYGERTRKNVEDSDGTLIVYEGKMRGGTALTYACAVEAGKPVLSVDVKTTPIDDAAASIRAWVAENGISVLNVAGPRASQAPGTYNETLRLLEAVFGGRPI